VSEIKIKFPDGQVKSYANGSRPSDILEEIGGRLAREAIAAIFNDAVIDLSKPLQDNGTLHFLDAKSPEGIKVFWHSSAHVMAHAVKELFPEAKFAFGPPVDEGFYYDIYVEKAFTPDDLVRIEEKMH